MDNTTIKDNKESPVSNSLVVDAGVRSTSATEADPDEVTDGTKHQNADYQEHAANECAARERNVYNITDQYSINLESRSGSVFCSILTALLAVHNTVVSVRALVALEVNVNAGVRRRAPSARIARNA